MIVAYAIAILLPLGFLYLIYAQDLYGQGKFSHVLFSSGWGLAAFGAAYGIAVLLKGFLTQSFGSTIEAQNWMDAWHPVLIAPIVEEVLKSLILIVLVRWMTYFVDGAIYGFAAGIAFSILENILYLSRGEAGTAILLVILRVFSTCLMHGAASALVGTAIGRFRYGRGTGRVLSSILGWVLAIGLHMGFNRLVRLAEANRSTWLALGAVGVGLGGAVLIILFIRWGLAEEKRWIAETLGLKVRVTDQEISAVRQYERIDELLKPVLERFGEEKIELVEDFLLRQARLGIMRKTLTMSQDPRERQKLEQQIETMHEEMEGIRREVGTYCMVYVREIFTEEVLALYVTLDQRVAEIPEDAEDRLHGAIGTRLGEQASEGIGLWGRLEQEEGDEAG